MAESQNNPDNRNPDSMMPPLSDTGVGRGTNPASVPPSSLPSPPKLPSDSERRMSDFMDSVENQTESMKKMNRSQEDLNQTVKKSQNEFREHTKTLSAHLKEINQEIRDSQTIKKIRALEAKRIKSVTDEIASRELLSYKMGEEGSKRLASAKSEEEKEKILAEKKAEIISKNEQAIANAVIARRAKEREEELRLLATKSNKTPEAMASDPKFAEYTKAQLILDDAIKNNISELIELQEYQLEEQEEGRVTFQQWLDTDGRSISLNLQEMEKQNQQILVELRKNPIVEAIKWVFGSLIKIALMILIGVVAGAFVGYYLKWASIIWNGIKSLTGVIFTRIGDFVAKFMAKFPNLTEYFIKVKTFLTGLIEKMPKLTEFFVKLKSMAMTVFDVVKGFGLRIGGFVGRLGSWFTGTRAILTGGVAFVMKMIGGVMGVFGSALSFVLNFIKGFRIGLKLISKIFWPLQIILSIIDGIIGAFKGFSKDGIAGAVMGMLANIISGLTFGLLKFDWLYDGFKWVYDNIIIPVIEGIGAVFTAIYDSMVWWWNNITWPVIKAMGNVVDFIWGIIRNLVVVPFNMLVFGINFYLEMTYDITMRVFDAIMTRIKGLWSDTMTVLDFAWNTIKSGFNAVLDSVLSGIDYIYNQFILPVFDSIADFFRPVIDFFAPLYDQYVKPLVDAVVSFFTQSSTSWDSIYEDYVSPVLNAIKAFFNGLANSFKTMDEYLYSVFSTFGYKKIFGDSSETPTSTPASEQSSSATPTPPKSLVASVAASSASTLSGLVNKASDIRESAMDNIVTPGVESISGMMQSVGEKALESNLLSGATWMLGQAKTLLMGAASQAQPVVINAPSTNVVGGQGGGQPVAMMSSSSRNNDPTFRALSLMESPSV